MLEKGHVVHRSCPLGSAPMGSTSLWLPNLALIGLVLLYFSGLTCSGMRRVEHLVVADETTTGKILALERAMSQGGTESRWAALELSRLYSTAGVFPWSYDALKQAEASARGLRNPVWWLKLGIAYVAVGHNDEGRRVLSRELKRCEEEDCSEEMHARLVLFARIVELMAERRIDARYDQARVDQVFKEVLKPAESTGLAPPNVESHAPANPALRETR